EAPENSMPALELGMRLGADAIELDVRRSADGVLIVIHDASLDRSTDASGEVARLTMAEIETANLGAASDVRIPRLAERAGVPRLRDVFDRFPHTEITVDVKDPAAAADVVALIYELNRVEHTILYVEEGTDSPAFIEYEGRRATSTRQALRLALDRGWLKRAAKRTVPEVVHTPMRRWGFPIVTQRLVQRVQETDRTIQVWTINEPTEARRLATWGVDGIITDDVRGLRAALHGEGDTK
ncbi:MAG: glycerophosphodiester phosphodiesterase family protein, partial [Gemmatimonadota bacterium]|nr:glycerophosphodiester phosphodiesterase family protein [Gemmatimonadota bacterium]